jgi:molybdopterin synthase sulfur carrier subunit
MIKVEVRLFATLRRYCPEADAKNGLVLEIPEGTSLNDLLSRLKVPIQEARILFVNNRKQTIDYVLEHGDKVGIFPQVAGG